MNLFWRFQPHCEKHLYLPAYLWNHDRSKRRNTCNLHAAQALSSFSDDRTTRLGSGAFRSFCDYCVILAKWWPRDFWDKQERRGRTGKGQRHRNWRLETQEEKCWWVSLGFLHWFWSNFQSDKSFLKTKELLRRRASARNVAGLFFTVFNKLTSTFSWYNPKFYSLHRSTLVLTGTSIPSLLKRQTFKTTQRVRS